MDCNNTTEDPPSPLWFEEDDTTTLFSEETTVVSTMTSPQDNDDDDDYHKYDDDDDESSNLQLSVILNELIPTDTVVPTNKDQWTDDPITNTKENSRNTTTSVVHTDKDACIPTGLSSSVKSDDDEPKKKKNDDTDTETIESDLSVEKILPSGDYDDDTNNDDDDGDDAVALANETANSRSATVDLVVENKAVNFAVDVGAETKTTSHDVTVAIPPPSSLLREEKAEDIQDVNQAFLSSCDTRNSDLHDATEAVYYHDDDDDDAMDVPSCDSTITTRATDRKANLTGTNRVIISVGMNESSNDTVKKPRFLKRIKKRFSKLSSKGGRKSSNNKNNTTSRRNGNNTAKACWYEHEDSVTGKHYYSHGKTTTWVRPEKELIVTW